MPMEMLEFIVDVAEMVSILAGAITAIFVMLKFSSNMGKFAGKIELSIEHLIARFERFSDENADQHKDITKSLEKTSDKCQDMSERLAVEEGGRLGKD